MKNRAYSILTVKSIDEDKREITGMATTPTPDRMQDIVEPKGGKFKLPLPFLWQHDAESPVGHVVAAKVSDAGIEIKAKLVKITEPGTLKDRLDEAWQSIKAGLVQGLSIGFRPLEHSRIEGSHGYRFLSWELFEVSAVTVPANADTTISMIKSLDEEALAANGSLERLPPEEKAKSPPSDVGKPKQPAAKSGFSVTHKKGKEMNIQEQITALEAARAANQARMEAIMQKSIDEGRSTDESESEEFDTLVDEVKAADDDLVRLRTVEKLQLSKAKPVVKEAGEDPAAGTQARSGSQPYIRVEQNVEKGADFVRFAMAIMQAKGNLMQAEQIAASRWKDSHRVHTSLKSAVAAGTTSDSTWAAPLVEYTTMASEFIDLLRPATLIGRIPGGLRRVPFKVRIQRQTAGVTGAFVGEGLPKPVNKLTFDAITLDNFKAAVIVVMTMELMRFSDPSAEAVVRQDMIDGITAFLDKRFIDPQYSATSSSPASITNGIVPIASTGSTIAAITNDVENLMGAFIAGNLSLSRAVWFMSPVTALSLAMKRDTQDRFAFPTVTPDGGTFFGRPVLTSTAIAAAGSPTEQLIVLMDPYAVLLADDGDISIDMSQEASLQMDDAPSSGAQSLVSLWQNNMAALRAERMINWMRRRDAAVQVLGNANW